jgi:hypothetical protein
MKMSEDFVQLNVHEIGIILSALQNLTGGDEYLIARDYGSAPALYNKLYSIFEQMDRSSVDLRYDVAPSY